jgi:hypothetical protein
VQRISFSNTKIEDIKILKEFVALVEKHANSQMQRMMGYLVLMSYFN